MLVGAAVQVQAAALANPCVLEVLGSQKIVEKVRDLTNGTMGIGTLHAHRAGFLQGLGAECCSLGRG